MTSIWDAPHTVYLHRDSAGGVLYVGCTANLDQRTGDHRRTAYWWPQVASVDVDSVQDGRDAGLLRESALIREHEPPHNRAGNPAVDREKDAWQVIAGAYCVDGAQRLEQRFGTAVAALAGIADLTPEQVRAITYPYSARVRDLENHVRRLFDNFGDMPELAALLAERDASMRGAA